jgi:signal transduction histidine kinase/ligand-binding sensor domain-containing protein/CheY-like chemotaxis protein
MKRSMRSRLAFVCLLVLCGTPALALDPARPIDLYPIDVWREGLPQYMIRAIAQTDDGYLWAGTMEGLVRFNGSEFEVFDRVNTSALHDQRIRALCVDKSGTLWIGTGGGGLTRYRDGAFTFEGLAGESVLSLIETRDHALFIGTSHGLASLRNGVLTKLDGAPAGEVLALAEGNDGALWVRASGGVARLDGKRFTAIAAIPAQTSPVQPLTIANDGSIWCAQQPDQLVHIVQGRVEPTKLPFATAYINDIREDRRGTLWIATTAGVARLRNGKFELLEKKDGLPNNTIKTLFEDREGSLWLGTDGGLARLKDLKFVTYSARHGLTEENTRVVAEARDGGLWIGTYGGGVDLLRDGVVTAYGAKEGLYVRTICEGAGNDLWIGSDRGLAHLQNGQLTFFTTKEGLANDKVDGIVMRRDGSLLISTAEGVQVMRDGRFAPLLAKPNRAAANPRVMLKRAGGTIWLGTYNGLMLVRDGEVVRTLTTRDGLPSNMIFALIEEANGDLWIGTHEGLARLRNGRIASITPREGLPYNVVFTILDDGRGQFWLTSNRGLTRVSRASIDAVLEHRAPRITAITFGKSDGMGSDQCNGATQPSGTRLRNGTLAIPTVAGLTIIDPADLHLNHVAPGIVLRDVLIDGKHIGPGLRGPGLSPAYVPWSSKRYEFRYDGISLLAPDLVRFRYRMDGFDESWIDGGNRKVASYNSLSPGRHTFHVAAINNDGTWSSGDASFSFELPAPPWIRWWAIALYVLAAIAIVFAFVRLRERTMKGRTALLERKVHERTLELEEAETRAVDANRAKSVFLANMSHELRTPLNAVIGFAQLLARSATLSDSDRESLATIRRSGEHLLRLINDVLSISKIEAGKLSLEPRPFDPREMFDEVTEMIRVRAEVAGLDLVIDVDKRMPRAVIGDEGKLRQILINLLGNAVKFTGAGTIAMHAQWTAGNLSIEISDTGHGIAETELTTLFEPFVQTESGRRAKEGTGLGLAITRELVELMGGEISVSSRVGAGTTFRLRLPLQLSSQPIARTESRRVIGLARGETPRRIAIVDDTPENRVLLIRLLESTGFEVAEATNGLEAVELWRRWRPDLIFMDQRMPLMDGSEATRAIRAEDPNTIIIALTASAFEHEREAILAHGANEFVVKPYAEERIFEVIARHLGVRYAYDKPIGHRVLLVDDDAITRHVARAMLVGLGLEVSEASSGVQALDRLENGAFDAVLLDVEMPILDGHATVLQIRERERFRDLPVIAMTAHARGETQLDDMTDYIGKPVNEEQLAAVLGKYVRVLTATS